MLSSSQSRTLLSENPDIIIATPSRVVSLLQSKASSTVINVHYLHVTPSPQTLSLSSLESLIIDEADLILSYGHDEDVRQLFGGAFFPKVFQSFLMSATMTEDVEALKGLALRNPVCFTYSAILTYYILKSIVRPYLNSKKTRTKLQI